MAQLLSIIQSLSTDHKWISVINGVYDPIEQRFVEWYPIGFAREPHIPLDQQVEPPASRPDYSIRHPAAAYSSVDEGLGFNAVKLYLPVGSMSEITLLAQLIGADESTGCRAHWMKPSVLCIIMWDRHPVYQLFKDAEFRLAPRTGVSYNEYHGTK